MAKGHRKQPQEVICATCGVIFLGKHYLSKYCSKECKHNNVERKENAKQKLKEAALLRLYGISIEQYHNLVFIQNKKCAICLETPERLYVDHDHSTGMVRGLLCMKCNAALGLFQDKIDNIKNAATYLETAQSLKKVRG